MMIVVSNLRRFLGEDLQNRKSYKRLTYKEIHRATGIGLSVLRHLAWGQTRRIKWTSVNALLTYVDRTPVTVKRGFFLAELLDGYELVDRAEEVEKMKKLRGRKKKKPTKQESKLQEISRKTKIPFPALRAMCDNTTKQINLEYVNVLCGYLDIDLNQLVYTGGLLEKKEWEEHIQFVSDHYPYRASKKTEICNPIEAHNPSGDLAK